MENINSRRKKRDPLNDAQKAILVKYFDKGMTGTKPSYMPAIEEAAKEAVAPIEKVKQWIGNQRSRKRKAARETPAGDSTGESHGSKTTKLPSFLKGASSYNRYSAEIFKTDECRKLPSLSEKHKLVSAKWAQLNEEERKGYKRTPGSKDIELDSLGPEEKEQMKKTYIKQLQEIISFLEDLGCTTSLIMLDGDKGSLCGMGSNDGQKFLSCNPDVVLKFRQHFAVKDESNTLSTKTEMFKSVQTLFNSKYNTEVANKSVNEGILIEEQHLEVVDLSLSQEDLAVVASRGEPFFSLDAWVSLGENIISLLSRDTEKGLIVPVYTDVEDEPYWLFYIPAQPVSRLTKITPNRSLNGYWLDKRDGNTYDLLYDTCSIIYGRNIVKCNNGIPLYVKAFLQIANEVTFYLPRSFHYAFSSVVNAPKKINIQGN
ncbi:hypothetical protein AC249_AIPGENE18669 [Exaiptasia diaphana]|nr:hypothetical protein AC249_AIPGENE18669 [Exaiptasia diaphana]